MREPDGPKSSRRWPAAVLCVALALCFSLHAWFASSKKSPTFDEPVYALSAWLSVNRGDFRLNPEHPALWKYLPGAALVGVPLDVPLDAPAGRGLLRGVVEDQWPFTIATIFRTPGNDGVALVARARVAMALLPLAIALVVARWAWRLAGPAAAVCATLLLSLDPNLLAHGALVTNDVAATLIFTVAGYLTWRLGVTFGWPVAAGLAATLAAGIGVKASCALAVAIAAALLLGRAALAARAGADRRRALVRTVATLALAAALGLFFTWATYRFRADPTPAGERFDPTLVRRFAAYQEALTEAARAGETVDAATLRRRAETRPLSMPARALCWLEDRRLLPQSYAMGLLYVRAKATARPAFFLGEVRDVGSPWYFPLALAFKTPTATLVLAGLAIVVVGPLAVRRLRVDAAARWAAIALLAPPTIYFALAIVANLNIGVRHVLPTLPFTYVAIGVAGAGAIARWRKAMPIVAAGIVATGVEVALSFPNYLAFFNVPSGGARGGLSKLGDSNLDWGQDLPALAEWYALWRRGNPATPFYLSYFGSVDPRVYGIDYVNATPGYPFDPRPASDAYARDGGVLAISATALQGLVDAPSRPLMAALRRAEPLDVVNGSIYIYRLSASPGESDDPQ